MPDQAEGPSPPTLADDALDALWIAMVDVYGHKWTSAFGVDPQTGSGSTWARGLAGMNARQLGAGIDAAIASADPWPPSLPEFRGMCLSIPSLGEVRHELHADAAVRTPFTVLVWQGIDSYAFRLASREQADRMIRDAYELAREHVMCGGELPGQVAGELAEPEKPEIKMADPDAPSRAREALWGESGKMAAAGPDA